MPGLTAESDGIRIDVESADADRLLGFYFGGFARLSGGDPVEAGLLEKRKKTWFLRNEDAWSDDMTEVAKGHLSALLVSLDGKMQLVEEELESFVRTSYYDVRAFPTTLDSLKAHLGSWNEPSWFRISLRGSMVPLERTTWVRRSRIESALDRMSALGDSVIYEVGTVFIGEHRDQGEIVETTVMQKRADGFWDFWAYDASGQLLDRIRKEPRDMLIPTRCTGCHFGDRQFEPERSYPGFAQPGPRGERSLEIPEQWRNPVLATSIQEHARRSDTILGLYVTLYLAEAASSHGASSPYLESSELTPPGSRFFHTQELPCRQESSVSIMPSSMHTTE